jgi:hypothetical protein
MDLKLGLVALLGALAGCDYITGSFLTNGFSGDPFPVPVETTSGAVVVGLQVDNQSPPPHIAVLDVMSPVTVVDPGNDKQTISYPQLTLEGLDPATGMLDKPRARFDDQQLVTIHPCTDPSCAVGTPASPRPIDAILGMDAFVSDALRLDLGASQLFVLPDIAGDDSNRGLSCDAVLPQAFRGGGTMLVGGTEVAFANWRIPIDTCIAPNPDASTQDQRGANMLLVLSTAVGVTIFDESAYERYRQVVTSAPDVSTLPDASVLLPSGVITGKQTTIGSLALVGNSSANPRSPCRQVYAHHLLTKGDCVAGDDCPCHSATTDTPTFCAVPAIIELNPPTPIDVLVVSDADPTLQALRAELRPDEPEADGILGANVLSALELDLDYPHDRALGRCVAKAPCLDNPGACCARPALSGEDRRISVHDCLMPPGSIMRRP